MMGPLTSLDWLGEAFSTTSQRIAVTAVALGVLVGVLAFARRLQRRLDARLSTLHADVIMTVVLVGTCLLTVSVTLGVWELTEEVRGLLTRFDLGGNVLARGAVSFVIAVTAYIVNRFTSRLIHDVLDPATSVSDHEREITTRVAQVVIWGFTSVVVLSIWIEDLGSVLVGAGFLGIVLGMAAQKTLGSMLSGFVLMFSRPFEIGDWIAVDDYHGIVTDISIVNTRIQTFDGEYVSVPNDVIGSSVVTNRSRRGRLRVEVEVGVDYATDVERASALAEAAVADVDLSMSVPKPQVVTKSFADSSVVLGVRFWIENPNARRMWTARTEAIWAIKEAFQAEGIKIPFPQRELSGRAETDGFRVRREGFAYDESEATAEGEGRSGSGSQGPAAGTDRRSEASDRRTEDR